MKVLEALNYSLVVFHPYRSLSEYVLTFLYCSSEVYKMNMFWYLNALFFNREEMIASVSDNTYKKNLQSCHSDYLRFLQDAALNDVNMNQMTW